MAAVRTYMRITTSEVDGEFLSQVERSCQILESKLKVIPEGDWWRGVSCPMGATLVTLKTAQ